MARLIDADLAIQKSKEPSIYDLTDFEEFINTFPTVDAEPVRYGEWIDVRGGYLFECSRCKTQVNSMQFKSNLKYCPNCGAKMTGGIENG